MRCLACDVELNDYEATRKYAESGEFIDLCNSCFSHVKEDIDVSDVKPMEFLVELEDETDDLEEDWFNDEENYD